MAKTLIGQLILRLRTEGLREAKKVTDAMRSVENAARRLGATGTSTWGVGFQRQLDKLKLSAQDIQTVERSWIQLHDSMKKRNLASALRSSEIGHWKTNTISMLAQGRAEMDRHMQLAEKAARGHASRMQNILKPGLVMLGAYTAPYFAGILGAEALTASSERRREIFRQRMAGIPEGDQSKLFDRSEAIAQKYPSIPITGIMEMSRSAFSVMGDADRAAAVLERMAESLVVMQSARGADAAAGQLIGLIRGLDNLGANKDGQIGIDQVNDMISAATRAAQVDPDFDPEKWFQFARATKVAGPALSMDFLARAPVYIQDMGDGATGNALAMAFRAFVLEAVGSAGGKKYLQERDRIGVRQNGKLVDSELFGSNPDQWVLKHLVPALQRDGVDLNNDTQVAAAVGKLSGNTTATGFLTRIITQREQVARWLDLMDKSMGTDAAKDVRFEDPFVGWTAFKKSLENLSAALVPIDSINAGLNGLADGINKLAAAAKDHPLLTALGIGAAGYGTYKAGSFAFGKMADMFGLKSSALALDGSAAALTRAAVALGGSGVLGGDLPGKKGGGGGKGLWGLLGVGGRALGTMGVLGLGVQALGDTPGDTFEKQVKYQRQYREFLERLLGVGGAGAAKDRASTAPSFRQLEDASMHSYRRDKRDIDDMIAESRAAGQQIQENLSPTAKPDVDTSGIDVAIQKARTLLGLLTSAGAAASRASNNVGSEMRRNFSDGSGGGGW